jgi:outer membrane protein OmpA-like peptidoglycan-associated protein
MRRTAALAAATLLLTTPASGAQDAPTDPLAEGAPPTRAELADATTVLELEIVALEPEVRSLRTDTTEGDRTIVGISADVLFDFGSAELTDAARAVLAGLADEVGAAEGPIDVVGHTDGIGTDEFNQDLSLRRAESVAQALRAELGGDRTVTTEGRASSEPLQPETVGGQDDPDARARNRRVEISYTSPQA